MRVLLVLVALGLAGGAIYFAILAKSSYSSYSAEQLQVLESGFLDLAQPTEDQLFSRDMLREEKQRRLVFPALAGAALLVAIAAFFIRGRSTYVGASPDEEARFAATMGNPLLVVEGARNKAANLLGVTVNAPLEVIEAALAAQLASRDPARMNGLAPDLKAIALEQREELIKARDLLMKKLG